jgi:hypothetical protein
VIGWLLLLQSGLPTVGDTIWVRRVVAAPPGRAVRAADWAPTGEIEVLGRPRVTLRGDSAEVAYPVVLWAPGAHTVQVPGPLLVGGDGRVDSLPAANVTLAAASVLPPGPHDTLRPQPTTPPVALREVSLRPLLALWALAIGLLVPMHLWWRRHGRPVPVAVIGPVDTLEPEVTRWAEAGEPRAVVGVAVERLRATIAAQVPGVGPEMDTEVCLALLAEQRPGWPLTELADLLRALDEARFAHGGEVDAVGMYRWAGEMERRITGAEG